MKRKGRSFRHDSYPEGKEIKKRKLAKTPTAIQEIWAPTLSLPTAAGEGSSITLEGGGWSIVCQVGEKKVPHGIEACSLGAGSSAGFDEGRPPVCDKRLLSASENGEKAP